jgi:hypothetical protein
LVQNVARFLCVAEGLDPNQILTPADEVPWSLRDGRKVYTGERNGIPAWMLFAERARTAIATVDMARENIADNGDQATGKAAFDSLTVDREFAASLGWDAQGRPIGGADG